MSGAGKRRRRRERLLSLREVARPLYSLQQQAMRRSSFRCFSLSRVRVRCWRDVVSKDACARADAGQVMMEAAWSRFWRAARRRACCRPPRPQQMGSARPQILCVKAKGVQPRCTGPGRDMEAVQAVRRRREQGPFKFVRWARQARRVADRRPWQRRARLPRHCHTKAVAGTRPRRLNGAGAEDAPSPPSSPRLHSLHQRREGSTEIGRGGKRRLPLGAHSSLQALWFASKPPPVSSAPSSAQSLGRKKNLGARGAQEKF